MMKRLFPRRSLLSVYQKKDGFTIVEVMIAVGISTILSGILFTLLIEYYGSAIRSHETAQMALESQAILSQITEDVRLASGISANNVTADANNEAGWSTNEAQNVLIIQSPVVDRDLKIIYDPATGYPYNNEYVYFIRSGTLYKRILRNENAVGNTAETTCPKESTTPACGADRLFSSNVSDLQFTFYDTTNSVTNDPAKARSIKLGVSLQKKVFGKDIVISNSTQITQRN